MNTRQVLMKEERRKKEADGEIVWISEPCVGYKCKCGKEIVVEGPHNTCPNCGKKYILRQTNTVFEVEKD